MLLSLLSGEARAAGLWPFGSDGIDYQVRIEGADKEMQDWFSQLDLDEKTADHPPQTLDDLDSDGAQRSNRLRQALAAKGYYDPVVDYHLTKEADPPVIGYTIVQGPRYRIASVGVEWEGGQLRPLDSGQFPVKAGQFVDAEAINDYGSKLAAELGKDACLLSLGITPKLLLDPQQQGAALVYHIKHGPRANFGPVTLQGNKRLSDKAILLHIAWKEGECFNDAKLTKTQSALVGTQLFSVVKITPGTEVDGNGEVPIAISVHERVEHTISAGVNYATDQGFGTKLGWENRNVFGDAQKLNADATIAQQQQSLQLTERVPGFWRDDQTLVLSGGVTRENTDAYTSQDIQATALIERRLSPQWNTGLGAGILLDRSDDAIQGQQNYGLVFLPGFAEYDSRDNAQDARKGVYGHLALTPYVDTFDTDTRFVKFLATGQTYLSSDVIGQPTLALRLSVGGIEGATAANLPANLRFYAGGGGSVRGYSYQSLSPRTNGTPVGGGSLIEMSSELRVRFSDDFGGVIFLDGGNAYSASIPDFSDPLYYGAGAGIRYYSPIGPIRLDAGFPLNGQNIDGSGGSETGMQIYISLGQAF